MRTLFRTCAVGGLVLLASPAAPQQSGAAAPPAVLLAQGDGVPGRPALPPRPPRRGGPPSGDWVDEPFQRTVRLGSRGSLELTALFGTITFTGTDGNVVRINAVKRVQEANRDFARTVLQNVQVRVTERGGGIEVLTEQPTVRTPIAVDYTIEVPMATSVSIRSFGGPISVGAVKGELRIEASGGGDMTLSSVGRVRNAKSAAGNVTITGAEGDEVNAETLLGRLVVRDVKARSVELRSIGGPITIVDTLCDRCTANSVNGSIEFSGPLKPEGRYTLNSSGGDIRFIPSPGVGFDLEAMTSGTFSNDFPLRTGRTAPPAPGSQGRIFRGVFMDGSAILSLRSFTGNVSLIRKSDPR
jgi:putative adhesin